MKNDFSKIALFQLWPVRSRLYRREISKIRPFGPRTRRDLTEYAKKKIRKILDFLSKFSTIISQRNRRLAQFCKKLGLQNFILSRKSRSKTSGTPSGGVEHEIWTFFILRIRKTNRYNSFWFILARGGAHASLRAGKNRWKSRFLIQFSKFSVCIVNIWSSWNVRFLQNLRIRRFRKVMIKTSFQLFLLINDEGTACVQTDCVQTEIDASPCNVDFLKFSLANPDQKKTCKQGPPLFMFSHMGEIWCQNYCDFMKISRFENVIFVCLSFCPSLRIICKGVEN